jgi:hypothetical protein
VAALGPGADLMTPQAGHVVVRDDATGVALYLPPGWSRIDADGMQLAIAAGDARQSSTEGDTFTPNINVLVAPVAADADASLLGTTAVSAAMVTAEDVHVLAYDIWPTSAGVEGRRIMFAYRHGSSTVAVSQWVFVSGGQSCTVTASCPVSALVPVTPALDYAIAGLQLPSVAA